MFDTEPDVGTDSSVGTSLVVGVQTRIVMVVKIATTTGPLLPSVICADGALPVNPEDVDETVNWLPSAPHGTRDVDVNTCAASGLFRQRQIVRGNITLQADVQCLENQTMVHKSPPSAPVPADKKTLHSGPMGHLK
jgi:hypothetical protein